MRRTQPFADFPLFQEIRSTFLATPLTVPRVGGIVVSAQGYFFDAQEVKTWHVMRCSRFSRLCAPGAPAALRTSLFPPWPRRRPADRGGGGKVDQFDFGAVPARGQQLKHRFRFVNDSDAPVRLRGATAGTPCCSSIELSTSTPVPPRGECDITCLLKILADRSRRKRVEFQVQTDSPATPVLRFALLASAHREWEVEDVEETPHFVPIGRSAVRKIRVTARRVGAEGEGFPSSVEGRPPLTARYVGGPVQDQSSDDVTSTHRDAEVMLPADSRPGAKQGLLVFRWPGPAARSREHQFLWEVVPPLRASPSDLVLQRARRYEPQIVIVSSWDGRPFRIKSVGPPVLVPNPRFAREPNRVHRLSLVVDWECACRAKSSKIVIETDSPDQRSVEIGILIIPG